MRHRILVPILLVAAGLTSRVLLDGAASDTTVQSLIAAEPMISPRAAHSATALSDGTVLIAGGFAQDREMEPFATIERFDPESRSFATVGEMTTARQSHTASALPDGRVLFAGGHGNEAMATAEIFDPLEGRPERRGRLAVPRAAHRATELPDGRVLLSGGLDSRGNVLGSVEIYDPQSESFAMAGSLLTARVGHTQTLLPDGTVLVVGGSSGRRAANAVLSTAEVFDPTSGTSTSVGDLHSPRYKHAAVALSDGRVLVVGGSDDRDWDGKYDSAEIYDPSTRSFSETARLNSPRFKLRTAAVRLTNGRVLIAGGSDVVELFDPATSTFAVVPDRLSSAFYFSTATALTEGRALIAGGYDHRIQSTSGAWLYQP